MKRGKNARVAPLALALALAAGGCDWLDPSGSTSRLSPEISDLQISPRSVFCGDPDRPPGSRNEILIVFGYSDQQEDILQFNLVFEHATLDDRITRTIDFEDPDLSLPPQQGTVSYREFFFECEGPPSGDWKVTVQAEDKKGHQSNELVGEVSLVSAR